MTTSRTKSPKNTQMHFKYLDPEMVIRVKTHVIRHGLTYRVFVFDALTAAIDKAEKEAKRAKPKK